MQNTPGYKEAQKLLQRNLSARAKALASLESYVAGRQYEGLPDWFTGDKPLWERAPCIVDPIVKKAIDSNGDLLLGEGRFPEARVDGLEGKDAEEFEKAVAKVEQQSRLKAAAREVFAAGQGCGSAAAVFGVRSGRLFIDTLLARWCVPKLARDGSVESLEVRYPYLAIKKNQDGEKVVCMLTRRSIDAQNDITYHPAEAREDDTEPSWIVAETGNHGFGFCPVVWFPHLRGCVSVTDYDGRAIHEHLTDEVRAHDFALSQRHRAALYAGDPQWTEIGVTPGHNPTGAGRTANMPASRSARPGDGAEGTYTESGGGRTSKARKKSPGSVWQYEGKAQEVKVQLHCLPGDALKALDDHAKDLRTKLAQALGVVFLEPESLPNESRLSGKALESFKAPQIGRVDYYRSDFGDRFLLPAIGMLLRIALVTKLKIPGIDAVNKAVVAVGKDLWSWVAPPINLVWGEYYKPSAEEEELMVRAGGAAILGGFATPKLIVKKLRGILGVSDVDAFMVELEAHSAEKQKQEQVMAEHAASLKPKPAASPAKAKSA